VSLATVFVPFAVLEATVLVPVAVLSAAVLVPSAVLSAAVLVPFATFLAALVVVSLTSELPLVSCASVVWAEVRSKPVAKIGRSIHFVKGFIGLISPLPLDAFLPGMVVLDSFALLRSIRA